MSQLTLGLDPPKELRRGRAPSKAAPPKTDGRDPHEVLEEWCEAEECLLFLWGENPNICAARSHSSNDPGIDRWVQRKRAEEILARHGYTHHANQVSPDAQGRQRRGRVYWRKGRART